MITATLIHNVSRQELEVMFENLNLQISELKKGLNNPETLITREEAAKFLRISLPTLSELSSKGEVVSYRLGGRVIYKQSDLTNSLKKVETI
jgi:excisionase family DNA binding protein